MSERLAGLLALVAASPSPSPSPSGSGAGEPKALDPNQVSPGLEGFLAVFALALVVILLVRSMVGRIRAIRYRAERSGELADAGPLPETAPRPRPVHSARPLPASPRSSEGPPAAQPSPGPGQP